MQKLDAEGLVSFSPVSAQLLLHCFIPRMWAVVFFNNNLCEEERATVEQSRTDVIAYQGEVCSWGNMCTVALVCPIFIKSVLCVPGVRAARCWTHFRYSAGRCTATVLMLSSISIFLYTSPQFLFPLFIYIFIREYPSVLDIMWKALKKSWLGFTALALMPADDSSACESEKNINK